MSLINIDCYNDALVYAVIGNNSQVVELMVNLGATNVDEVYHMARAAGNDAILGYLPIN
jgi:hypothetical protein